MAIPWGQKLLVNGTATLATSFANAGSYTVTATYAGDSNNTASTSSPVAITITPATSATTLEATPSAGNVNGQITLKASVSGDNPTGSVSFAAGTTSLGTATLTNGVATLQTSFGAAGSYATTATYQGDQNNAASTSSAVTIVIAAPDFTVDRYADIRDRDSGANGYLHLHGNSGSRLLGHGEIFLWPTTQRRRHVHLRPSSVAPSGGSPVSSTLTVTTAACHGRAQYGSAFQRHRFRHGSPLADSPSPEPWVLLSLPGRSDAGTVNCVCLAGDCYWHPYPLSVLSCGGGNNSPSNPGTPGRFLHDIGERDRQRRRTAARGKHRVVSSVARFTTDPIIAGAGVVRLYPIGPGNCGNSRVGPTREVPR